MTALEGRGLSQIPNDGRRSPSTTGYPHSIALVEPGAVCPKPTDIADHDHFVGGNNVTVFGEGVTLDEMEIGPADTTDRRVDPDPAPSDGMGFCTVQVASLSSAIPVQVRVRILSLECRGWATYWPSRMTTTGQLA